MASDNPPPSLDPNDPLVAAVTGANSAGQPYQVFHGAGDIPHRATGVRYYKNNDPQHMKPKTAGHVRCAIFDLSSDEQRKQYEATASLAYSFANHGRAAITAIDRQYNQQKGTWLVYLEWIEYYTYDPKGSSGHSHADQIAVRRR